jgi:acyl-CoA thioester hydrolase
MSDRHPLLEGFPIVTAIPLLWGDEDAFGHVNNVTYLRWCESVRVEYLCRIGLFPSLPPSGAGPILASMKCDYKWPLNFPDTVEVGARVTRIGTSSFHMEHRIVSRKLSRVAAEAESVLVVLDYGAGKSVPVPKETRVRIARLEGRSFER